MVSEPFIRLSSREPLHKIERTVRARAADCGDVFVLAEPGGLRQLRRLRRLLECEPVPGYGVKVWGRPDGGAILAVSAGPFWASAD